jgi:hypothetical protein
MAINITSGQNIHSISIIDRSEETNCAKFAEKVLALNTEKIPTEPNKWYFFATDNPIRGELDSLPIVLRQTPRANSLFRIPVCQDADPTLYQEDTVGFPSTDLNSSDVLGSGNNNCCDSERREDFYVPIQLERTFNAAAGNLGNGLDITQKVDDVYGFLLYLNNFGTFTLTYVFNRCEFHAMLQRESCQLFPETGIRALGVNNSSTLPWERNRGRNNGWNNNGCGSTQRVKVTTIR